MRARVFFRQEDVGFLEKTAANTFVFGNEAGRRISFSLAAESGAREYDSLPSFFDGLIPEGWLLTLAADMLKLNPIRDRFELLLATCADAIGAVSIRTESAVPNAESDHFDSQPKSWTKDQTAKFRRIFPRCLMCYGDLAAEEFLLHTKCSERMFHHKNIPSLELTQDQIETLAMRTLNQKLSVTGVQKKLSYDLKELDRKQIRLTLTDFQSRYILKPAAPSPHLPENEHLALVLASATGLKTANSTLFPMTDGTFAFLTERFDRPWGQEKVHVEDFSQILDKRPEQKYQGSYEQVAKKLRALCDEAPGDEVLKLFECCTFSFLIGNSDLHLKNISLFHEPSVRLAPIYDALCIFIDRDDDEEMALALNGKKNKLESSDFKAFGSSIGLNAKQIQNTFGKFQKAIPVWKEFVERSYLSSERKRRFTQMTQNRAERLFGSS